MTNDDLEKKIAEIIDSSVDDWATRDRRGRIQVHVSTIADILVKAGLKFDTVVSHTATIDMMQQDRINELEKRIVEAEHRAARAERALYIAAREVQYLSGNFGAMGEFLAKEKGVPYFMEQAKKELAEEEE